MRPSKPSIVLSSLLPKTTKKSTSSPSSPSSHSSPLLIDYDDSVLYVNTERGRELLLSVSRINAYFKCPYAFYLQYILSQTGTPSFFLSYGSSIHGCIEDLTPVWSVKQSITHS